MTTPTHSTRVPAPLWLVLGALVALLAVSYIGSSSASADGDKPQNTQFLSISGEGPTAKAWYEGAQPSGVPLQRALDKFNKEGYKIVALTEPHPSGGSGYIWNILMEKP